jgi:putative spermidine/putrescine transport system permease protein
MANASRDLKLPLPEARRTLFRFRGSFVWLPVLPFFAYIALFLLLPAIFVAVGALRSDTGGYTLDRLHTILQEQYLDAFLTSIKISAVTALGGGIMGLFVAYSAVREGAPRWLRNTLTTFSGVAANFAGVPLAFAFVATLGSTGIVTQFLAAHGVDLYGQGFSLFTFTGLCITYIYFQLPLMILIIIPSLDGLRKQWREAATNLGASTFQFWRFVGIPVLLPSLLASMVLLFGNAFSAYATPYALAGGQINLVPILIGAVYSGNVVVDPHLGDALAFGMIFVIGITVLIYAVLQRRTDRWLR